jgi:hypothetical protein
VDEIVLVMEGEGLDEETIRRQELDLRRMLLENVEDAEIAEPEASAQKGAKGDPITLGLITMTLIKSGAVVAMINCVKAMIMRQKKLKIKVKTKDGKTIEIDASNMDSDAVTKQLQASLNA